MKFKIKQDNPLKLRLLIFTLISFIHMKFLIWKVINFIYSSSKSLSFFNNLKKIAF